MAKGIPVGRDKINFTDKEWKTIDNCCAIHCTAEEIAGVLDISLDTLERRIDEKYNQTFAEFFKRRSAGGKQSIRHRQYQKAMAGSDQMLIHLGKHWLKQSDAIEHSGNINFNLAYNINEPDNIDTEAE